MFRMEQHTVARSARDTGMLKYIRTVSTQISSNHSLAPSKSLQISTSIVSRRLSSSSSSIQSMLFRISQFQSWFIWIPRLISSSIGVLDHCNTILLFIISLTLAAPDHSDIVCSCTSVLASEGHFPRSDFIVHASVFHHFPVRPHLDVLRVPGQVSDGQALSRANDVLYGCDRGAKPIGQVSLRPQSCTLDNQISWNKHIQQFNPCYIQHRQFYVCVQLTHSETNSPVSIPAVCIDWTSYIHRALKHRGTQVFVVIGIV